MVPASNPIYCTQTVYIQNYHSDWILLYIKRLLKAPLQLTDGTLLERRMGTPQGGVITP